MEKYFVPFKTPVDYYNDLGGRPIEDFPIMFKENPKRWEGHDCDLHVYPYAEAVPAILSMGCPNQCKFCPTAELHQGTVKQGDHEKILPNYAGKTVHFMDEDFFAGNHDRIKAVLNDTRRLGITFLAMTTYKSFEEAVETFGEFYLFESGLRVVEVGLENPSLMMKVPRVPRSFQRIVVYYLNMTFLEGETKKTVQEAAEWMRPHSLDHPIHFNNGIWYAPGQFYHPYSRPILEGGRWLNGQGAPPYKARVAPSFVPASFLQGDMGIANLEMVNYFCQLVYGFKLYFEKKSFSIDEFIGDSQKKAMWLAVGLRCGGVR